MKTNNIIIFIYAADQDNRVLVISPYREEVGIVHSPEEDDCHHCQITSKNNAGGKNLIQFPAIWHWRWFYSILWDSHDGSWKRNHNPSPSVSKKQFHMTNKKLRNIAESGFTIVQDGYDQDHKSREVVFPYQSNKHKTKLQ